MFLLLLQSLEKTKNAARSLVHRLRMGPRRSFDNSLNDRVVKLSLFSRLWASALELKDIALKRVQTSMKTKLFSNAVLFMLLYLSFELGASRATALSEADPLRITFMQEVEGATYIDGAIFGRTANGILLVGTGDFANSYGTATHQETVGAKFELRFVSDELVATVGPVPK